MDGRHDRGPLRLLHPLLLPLLLPPLLALPAAGCAGHFPRRQREPTAVERAIDYLAVEVARWSRENHCFSCHNNGDGARALYVARKLGHAVPEKALAETTAWLSRPGAWDDSPGDPSFSDRDLARLQFAAALGAAVEAGVVGERELLTRAALGVAELQRPEGSWSVEPAHALGSPATYGTHLATALARITLGRAGAPELRGAIGRADAWLRRTPVRSVLDSAAVLLALHDNDEPLDAAAMAQRRRCLDLLEHAQSDDGGWGPYPHSPTEPFDTAVALLALRSTTGVAGLHAMLRRGRHYLVAAQLDEGGWPETTRPPGEESYAQHISTSGWATLALLATADSGE